jgi:hypothetical protein
MNLAVAYRAPWCDDGKRHEARYNVDAKLADLLGSQRTPHHARRLIVWNHHIEFEKGCRGARVSWQQAHGNGGGAHRFQEFPAALAM